MCGRGGGGRFGAGRKEGTTFAFDYSRSTEVNRPTDRPTDRWREGERAREQESSPMPFTQTHDSVNGRERGTDRQTESGNGDGGGYRLQDRYSEGILAPRGEGYPHTG